MNIPITDLHCDLLSYLTRPNTTIYDTEEIGCAIPYLKEGNVKLQVMAIFAATEPDSVAHGFKQSKIFRDLREAENELYAFEKKHLETFAAEENTGMLAAVENGSAFCGEEMTLKEGFENLERLREEVGELLYISFTHHAENRFGGGNFSNAGLKNDGCALLDYLHGQQIAVDFSHTSDALAYGMLDYIARQNLRIPILASHSNYRHVYEHPRNLPNELAQEIIHQEGLIGLNFVRAFVNPDESQALQQHVAQGLALGAENAICYGADYFYTKSHPDKSRIPFYFKEHENAAAYPELNADFEEQFGQDLAHKIASKNAIAFIKRLWT